MRQRAVATTLFILISIGIMLYGYAFYAPTSQPRARTVVTASAEEPQSEDIENIPLSPAALQDSVVQSSDDSYHKTKYIALTSRKDVLDFYKKLLPQRGWILLTGDSFPAYEWVDETGRTPWGLYLDISAEEIDDSETYIIITMYRWPRLDRIPQFPDARYHSVVTEHTQDGNELQISTYELSAAPVDVEAFYKSALAKQGWKFSAEESMAIDSETGLLFRSLYGEGANLSIIVKSGPSDHSWLELRLETYELSLPHP